MAAQLVEELVTDHDVLGLSCSRNITATIERLSALAPCPVVQLTGTLTTTNGAPGSVESVRRAAHVGHGPAWPIYAPMLLPDAGTAESLSSQPDIRAALDRQREVTVALVSVGAWVQDGSSVWQSVDGADRQAGAAVGAVGEIGARLFDRRGHAVETPIDHRVLGITLDQLRQVPEVIALGLGISRADAIRAALEGGLVTSLVCDTDLAHRLLGRDRA
jgi:DNA-binding transcriptional regulator LsrR (DeoR family)